MLAPADGVAPASLKQFEGYQCPNGLTNQYLTFANPAYVFVSGSGGNPWGHCLLLIDPGIGFVHAAMPGMNRTLYLPVEEYQRYLLECGKVEWERKAIQFQPGRMEAARLLTNDFMTNGFYWVPWHDCVTMVDEIATAGGSGYVANTVFPDKAVAAIRRDRNPPQPSLFDTLKAKLPKW